jgi:hypothetical protein
VGFVAAKAFDVKSGVSKFIVNRKGPVDSIKARNHSHLAGRNCAHCHYSGFETSESGTRFTEFPVCVINFSTEKIAV